MYTTWGVYRLNSTLASSTGRNILNNSRAKFLKAENMLTERDYLRENLIHRNRFIGGSRKLDIGRFRSMRRWRERGGGK